MPHTRSDKKNLPNPRFEDEDTGSDMPRFENSLHLSDSMETTTFSQVPLQPSPLLASQSTSIQDAQRDSRSKRLVTLTPPIEVSREHSPSPSIPISGSMENAIPGEPAKSVSQTSSDFALSSLSPVVQQRLTECPPHRINNHDIASPSYNPPQDLGLDASMV